MNTRSLLCCTGLFGAIFYGRVLYAAEKPAIERKLDEKSIGQATLHDAGEHWESAFVSWIGANKLSGGILIDGRFLQKKRKPNASKKGFASGREMLNEIRTDNPDYEWKANNETINVLPRDMQKEHLKLFGAKVKSFSARARTSQLAIYELLKQFRIPVRMSYYLGGPKPKTDALRAFDCNDSTVIECINQLSRQSDGGFWYIRYDRKLKEFVISRGEGETFRDDAGQ